MRFFRFNELNNKSGKVMADHAVGLTLSYSF